MLYIFIGLLVVGALGIIFAVLVSMIISIVLGILYFFGLIFLIIRVKLLSKALLIKIHFNMCLILKNENERFY